MATLIIDTPNGQRVAIEVEDGGQDVEVHLQECSCGCGSWFQPRTPAQQFFTTEHQTRWNNERRRKTQRKRKVS